jgi:hypothetical protein
MVLTSEKNTRKNLSRESARMGGNKKEAMQDGKKQGKMAG